MSVLLYVLGASALAAWLVSWLRYDALAAALGPAIAWLTATPLVSWIVAFVGFQALLYLGFRLGSNAGTAALGGCGLVTAAAVLLIGQRAGQGAGLSCIASQRVRSHRAMWLGGGLVAAVGLLTLLATFAYSIPIAIGPDPMTYVVLSEGILGRRPLVLEHLTYVYPLVVAATRLLWDNVLSIVLLQHLVRIGVALGVFAALRGASFPLALIAGLLVAADPVAAYYAHSVLTESLYASGVAVAVLLSYRLGSRGARSPCLSVALGTLAAFLAVLRPAGLLLIVPLLLYVLIQTRSWRQPALAGAAFVAMALVLALGQWRVTGHFGLGAKSDAYYAFPILRYDLFDPDNGPLAAELYTYVPREDCRFSFPDQPLHLQTVSFPQALSSCVDSYSARTGTPPLSLAQVYREGIVTHPLAFVRGMLDETSHFITHSDWNRVATLVYVPRPLTASDPVTSRQCRAAMTPGGRALTADDGTVEWAGRPLEKSYLPGARVSLAPNPLRAPGTDAELTWSTGDATDGQVWVSQDGGPEVLVARSPSGTTKIPWIEQGTSYQFRLYAGESHATLLASVTVTTDQDYYCTDDFVPVSRVVTQFLPSWQTAYASLVQPYREQGPGFWERWWAALALLALVLIVSPPPLRSLAALCVLVIGYHAAVTAFGQWNLPRYVAVVLPEFELLTGLSVALVWAALVHAGRTAAAVVRAGSTGRSAVGALAVAWLALAGLALGAGNRALAEQRAAIVAVAAYPGGIAGSDPAQRPGERAAAAVPLLGEAETGQARWTRGAVRALVSTADGLSYQATSGAQRRLDGLEPPVRALAESPDGQRVGAIGADGVARLWDLGAKGPGLTIDEAGGARSIALGPDGAVLVGDASGVEVWRTGAAAPMRISDPQQGAITYVTTSPNGDLVVAADDSGRACLWETSVARLRGCTTKLQGPVVSAGWSPDAQLWATGSLDGALRVWDTADATEYAFRFVPSPYVYEIAFTPDNAHVAAATAEGKVAVWTVGSRGAALEQVVSEMALREWEQQTAGQYGQGAALPLWSVAWAPDGSVVVGDERGRVWRWPLLSGAGPMPIDETNRGAPALSLAVGPEGQVAAGGADRAVRLWAAAGAGAPSLLGEAGRAVYAVEWSDSTRVGATSWDGRTREWAATGALIREQPAQGAGRAVAVGPGGQRAVGEPKGGVRLETEDGRVVTRFAGGVGAVTALAWSADARWLAVGGTDGAVQLWDVRRGAVKATLVGARADVTGLAFGPGDRLAAVALNGSLRIWDLAALLGSE
ncbi:MAG TPA: hypothetical protein VII06_32290 [Chloroflexota bacterium]